MLLHFDYGDDWMFIVECLSIEDASNRKRKPEVLKLLDEFPEQYPDFEEENEEVSFGINPMTGERIEIKRKS
jgi:hypothetical protein